MKLQVRVDTAQAEAALQELGRQAPFALAVALTRTAEAAKVAVQQEMTRVFDRPTPFTINALRVVPATKTKLQADVFFKDFGGKRLEQAATRFASHVFGGDRPSKRFEIALRTKGLLRRDENIVAGQGARLDVYGNVSRAQIIEILRWFEAVGAEGYGGAKGKDIRAKRMAGTKRKYGQRYLFRRERPGRGIYLETALGFGKAIQPVLMFVRRSSYQRRLDYDAIVQRTFDVQFTRWFESAAEQAMRTAR